MKLDIAEINGKAKNGTHLSDIRQNIADFNWNTQNGMQFIEMELNISKYCRFEQMKHNITQKSIIWRKNTKWNTI